MSEPIVRVIKANPLNLSNQSVAVGNRLKVAAYARVSTDHEEQEDSFDRQVDYYTKYIQANPNWEFVKVYSDPGISGTRAEKRPGFQEMITDCRNGLINRIMVKSIARFARNTVDALNYIRELKELGVTIFFESQNIDTGSTGGDILLTILAATAEEESRTISKNVRWAYQKKFQKGDFVFDYKHFLGLTRDENHNVIIVEEEAQIVRRIYREFLAGYSISQIAIKLEKDGIKTAYGNKKWNYGTIKNILQNEKYYGAVLMGKSFKPDVLSKKRLKNEGQVESYFCENIIPPILDKVTWDMAQNEMKRRYDLAKHSHNNAKYNTKYPLSRMIRCGNCGAYYTRNNNMRENGKRVPSWWCISRTKKQTCHNRPLKESLVFERYLEVLNGIVGQTDDIKSIMKKSISQVVVNNPQSTIERLDNEINELQSDIVKLFQDKSNGKISPSEYAIKGSKLSKKIEEIKKEKEKLQTDYSSAAMFNQKINDLYNVLDNLKPTAEFDEDVFKRLIDMIVVTDNSLKFVFKCGIERTINI